MLPRASQMRLPTVRLIHWNANEAKDRAEKLEAAGYRVDYRQLGPQSLRELRAKPPAAVVIDLGRLPAQGRDVGIAIRSFKDTRRVPVVFVDGDPKKVKGVQKHLPDAVYTAWNRIRGSLKNAIARPPEDPVRPGSLMAGYAGAPLVKKLGIKTDSTIVLLSAPQSFRRMLGKLPKNVSFRLENRGRRNLTIWFVKTERELDRRINRMVDAVANGPLWIIWPKRTSKVPSDLTPARVRRVSEVAGLVDFKISKIDETWTGLKFTRKKKK